MTSSVKPEASWD